MSTGETHKPFVDQISRKNRKIFEGNFKAKVVVELLKGKKSLSELALQYDLHPNQIKNWKSLLLKRAGSLLEDKRRVRSAKKAKTE